MRPWHRPSLTWLTVPVGSARSPNVSPSPSSRPTISSRFLRLRVPRTSSGTGVLLERFDRGWAGRIQCGHLTEPGTVAPSDGVVGSACLIDLPLPAQLQLLE